MSLSSKILCGIDNNGLYLTEGYKGSNFDVKVTEEQYKEMVKALKDAGLSGAIDVRGYGNEAKIEGKPEQIELLKKEFPDLVVGQEVQKSNGKISVRLSKASNVGQRDHDEKVRDKVNSLFSSDEERKGFVQQQFGEKIDTILKNIVNKVGGNLVEIKSDGYYDIDKEARFRLDDYSYEKDKCDSINVRVTVGRWGSEAEIWVTARIDDYNKNISTGTNKYNDSIRIMDEEIDLGEDVTKESMSEVVNNLVSKLEGLAVAAITKKKQELDGALVAKSKNITTRGNLYGFEKYVPALAAIGDEFDSLIVLMNIGGGVGVVTPVNEDLINKVKEQLPVIQVTKNDSNRIGISDWRIAKQVNIAWLKTSRRNEHLTSEKSQFEVEVDLPYVSGRLVNRQFRDGNTISLVNQEKKLTGNQVLSRIKLPAVFKDYFMKASFNFYEYPRLEIEFDPDIYDVMTKEEIIEKIKTKCEATDFSDFGFRGIESVGEVLWSRDTKPIFEVEFETTHGTIGDDMIAIYREKTGDNSEVRYYR